MGRALAQGLLEKYWTQYILKVGQPLLNKEMGCGYKLSDLVSVDQIVLVLCSTGEWLPFNLNVNDSALV